MKKNILLLSILFSFALSSCDDNKDYDYSNEAPAKITDAAIESGPGAVYLSWKTPADPNLVYIRVEYTNEKNEKVNQIVNNNNIDPATGITRDTIAGFVSTVERTFTIYACNVRGTNVGGIELRRAPGEPVFNKVIETISVKSDFGGAAIEWKNEFPVDGYIVVNYSPTNNPGEITLKRFVASKNSQGTEFIPLTASNGDLLIGQDCKITVAVEDVAGNSSEIKTSTIAALPIDKLDRSDWSFPGYDPDSNEGTIGYSSHEVVGEGAYPNGHIIAMIDDDLGTFWHSSWSLGLEFPHWFILDMDENFPVTNIDFRRRINWGGVGQTGYTIYSCADEDAVDKNNPDSWTWQSHGSFDFNPDLDNAQIYRFQPNTVARYIKVYMGPEYRGLEQWGMISDLNVYTSAE